MELQLHAVYLIIKSFYVSWKLQFIICRLRDQTEDGSVHPGVLHPLRPAGHHELGLLLAGPQRRAWQDDPGHHHLADHDHPHQEHQLRPASQGERNRGGQSANLTFNF